MYPHELFLGVHLYGVMIGLGILDCFIVLYSYGKKMGFDSRCVDFIFYNAILSILVGFFSASLFQSLYNYIENPEQGFKMGESITFIGGLIGGAITFIVVYLIFRKFAYGKLSNITILASCCIVIAHAFGRIGCLFAGCCHGKYLGEESVFGGIYMKGNSDGWGYYVPTQLYEAIFLFVLFVILSILALKFKSKHTLSVYLVLYGIFRFIIEFYRADHRGKFLGVVSPSQFWSIVMITLGILLSVFYLIYPKLVKKKVKNG